MTEPLLLPCPFCKGAAYLSPGTELHPLNHGFCPDCGVIGPGRRRANSAVFAWNRRAPTLTAYEQNVLAAARTYREAMPDASRIFEEDETDALLDAACQPEDMP